MKICILGNTGKDIKKSYSGFVKTTYQGVKLNGHEVIGYDYKSHTIDQIYSFLMEQKFDILFTHLTFHHHHNTEDMLGVFDEIRNLNDTKIIHTMQDARTRPRYNGDVSFAFDMALVGQTENIPIFEKAGKIPVYYWPYSSLTYEKMGTYRRELDFGKPVFPGNPTSHPDRSEFLKRLQAKLPIKIIRTKSKDDIREKTLDFSVSSPCVLGLCTNYNHPIYGYFEVRPFQYLGAGACMIIRAYKGMENIISDDLYYRIDKYGDSGMNHLIEQGNKIKKSNTKEIREKAFNFIQKHHSCKVRMQQTIELIEGKRNKLDIFLDEI